MARVHTMVTDQTTMKPAEGPNQAKINPAGQVLADTHCALHCRRRPLRLC